jgi:hypothetical protein
VVLGQPRLRRQIPGFTDHRENLILVAGYKVTNDGEPRNHGFVFEVGWFFGKSTSKREPAPGEDEAHYGDRKPNPERRNALRALRGLPTRGAPR